MPERLTSGAGNGGSFHRSTSLDVVRLVAFLTVPCVHFFLNTDFYSTTVDGKTMPVLVVLCNAFMVCVPLFMLLTGYLNHQKVLTARYYRGILRILGSYILCGLACGIWINCFSGRDRVPIRELVEQLLRFELPSYAWYLEMYLGLFLLIPFLNILYHGLQTRRRKQLLILTLLVLTGLPRAVNIFNFSTPGWWQNPGLSDAYVQLVPDWWIQIFPLTYYFIGAYLSEYRVKLKTPLNLLLLAGNVLISGAFHVYRSWGGVFRFGSWNDWGSPEVTVSSVLVFLLLVNLDTSRWPDRLRRVLGRLSGLTLSAYLLSYIFDQIYYPVLRASVFGMRERFYRFPLMVLLVVVSSLALAAVTEAVNGLLQRGLGHITVRPAADRSSSDD